MKYRKQPVEIEAFQYDGDLMNSDGEYYVPEWAINAFDNGELYFNSDKEPGQLYVRTLEGDMLVNVGDYVIQGIHEELYACKPEIFKRTYESADAPRIVYARWFPDGGVEVFDLDGLKAELKGISKEELNKWHKHLTDAVELNVDFDVDTKPEFDIEEIWQEANNGTF